MFICFGTISTQHGCNGHVYIYISHHYAYHSIGKGLQTSSLRGLPTTILQQLCRRHSFLPFSPFTSTAVFLPTINATCLHILVGFCLPPHFLFLCLFISFVFVFLLFVLICILLGFFFPCFALSQVHHDINRNEVEYFLIGYPWYKAPVIC